MQVIQRRSRIVVSYFDEARQEYICPQVFKEVFTIKSGTTLKKCLRRTYRVLSQASYLVILSLRENLTFEFRETCLHRLEIGFSFSKIRYLYKSYSEAKQT